MSSNLNGIRSDEPTPVEGIDPNETAAEVAARSIIVEGPRPSTDDPSYRVPPPSDTAWREPAQTGYQPTWSRPMDGPPVPHPSGSEDAKLLGALDNMQAWMRAKKDAQPRLLYLWLALSRPGFAEEELTATGIADTAGLHLGLLYVMASSPPVISEDVSDRAFKTVLAAAGVLALENGRDQSTIADVVRATATLLKKRAAGGMLDTPVLAVLRGKFAQDLQPTADLAEIRTGITQILERQNIRQRRLSATALIGMSIVALALAAAALASVNEQWRPSWVTQVLASR